MHVLQVESQDDVLAIFGGANHFQDVTEPLLLACYHPDELRVHALTNFYTLFQVKQLPGVSQSLRIFIQGKLAREIFT